MYVHMSVCSSMHWVSTGGVKCLVPQMANSGQELSLKALATN